MATKTFPITACLPVIYSGGSGVNAGDLHLPIGEWAAGAGTGWNTRALLKAGVSFAGMTYITEARLYLYQHTAGPWHAKGSGASTYDTRRKTADWSEASGGGSTGTDETWGGDSGSLASGGFTDDGDGAGSADNGAADGALDYVRITLAVRAWFGGAPNYGLLVFASGAAAADAMEFYSRRASGRVPYIWIDYETNTPPAPPYGLAPGDGSIVHTGRTVTYSGTRNDVDAGDYLTAYELQVFLTDHSTLIQSFNSGTLSGQPLTFAKALTLPSGYNANREYGFRARTRDKASAWSPWSPFNDFRANTVPATPPAPTLEGDTLTPTIYGSANDNDPGDSCDAVAIEVERVSGAVDMWTSGNLPISASPWEKPYAGAALAFGTQYRCRYRTRDTYGAFSAWSPYRTWTPVQPVGPSNMTPRSTATKQNTLTPTLTVGHSATFKNDEIEVYAANSLSATKLWTRPTTADYALVSSKAYPYAGAPLSWGATYYWRSRVKLSDGTLTAWSALVPFYVNAEPGVPASLAATNAAEVAPVVDGSRYVVTTVTPRLEAVYADPDLETYGDLPSSRTVEIYARNADGTTGALKHANTLPAPPYAIPMAYAVPAGAGLAIGSEYLVRWRFADNAGRTGPWSASLHLAVAAGPTLTLVAPAAGSTIVDSTPTLDWTFAGAAGKVQETFRVLVFDVGEAGIPYPDGEQLVHDSGMILGTATAYDVPPGTIVDDHTYRWTVTATDTDGLASTLA